jgi:Zn-dependent protease
MTEPSPAETVADVAAPSRRSWALAFTLFGLTFLSTSLVGAWMQGADPLSEGLPRLQERWAALSEGFGYSIPLLAILLCHEFGHYIAARIHRVPASPPFFVPMPLPPLGTMGAVILMPGRIARRDALFDIGAAGPLAGLCVALPVLVYGLMTSPVEALKPDVMYFVEGRSLLYLGLIYLTKGPIPAGHDVMLNGVAFAGWTGLFVTMLNLIPSGQLDGGHVAYALLGKRQRQVSRWVRLALLPLGVGVSLAYGLPAYLAGIGGDELESQFAPGFPWLMWFVVLSVFRRMAQDEHPPTDPGELSPRRRWLALGTLLLFPLLFMPAWLRASGHIGQ